MAKKKPVNDKKKPVNDKKKPVNVKKKPVNDKKKPVNDKKKPVNVKKKPVNEHFFIFWPNNVEIENTKNMASLTYVPRYGIKQKISKSEVNSPFNTSNGTPCTKITYFPLA